LIAGCLAECRAHGGLPQVTEDIEIYIGQFRFPGVATLDFLSSLVSAQNGSLWQTGFLSYLLSAFEAFLLANIC